MERVKGIEPSYSTWKADVLPLNYTRILTFGKANYKNQITNPKYLSADRQEFQILIT